MAGLETINATVREYASEKDVFMAQIVENTARQDLMPMEQADSYRQALLYGIDIADLSEKTGVSVATIAADVEMAAITDPIIRKGINDGQIPKAIGRELANFDSSKIRTAWKWASAGKTVQQMKARLDAYRQESGQIVFGFDYTTNPETMREDLKKAGEDFDKWMRQTQKFLTKYGTAEKAPLAVKAKERQLNKMELFVKEVSKVADLLKANIAACEAQKPQARKAVNE